MPVPSLFLLKYTAAKIKWEEIQIIVLSTQILFDNKAVIKNFSSKRST